MKILIMHGPNLNLLGLREPEIYGNLRLEEINQLVKDFGKKLEVDVVCFQSNHEGALIDSLHDARTWADGVVINPGGYTHTSVSLRDAIAGIGIPVVEIHMSNVDAREEFRHKSLVTPVCSGKISGFGWRSYTLGLQAVFDLLSSDRK